MKTSRLGAGNWLALALVLVAATAAYWTHFDGEFHFDDEHTIVSNLFVRDLGNWPCFFFDFVEPCNTRAVATFSSLPSHGSYRPLVTLSLAIDHTLSGGLEPFWFHLTNFAWFLALGAALFWLGIGVYRRLVPEGEPPAAAGLAVWLVAWYVLNPVNAETVNYIIARSDLFSTLGVVLGLAMFQADGPLRRWYIYLIPVALGILAKPTAVMFLPILAAYLAYIERPAALVGPVHQTAGAWARALAPAAVICIGGFGLVRYMEREFYVPGGSELLPYLWTQPLVYVHYVVQWLLPLRLSADTDWVALPSPVESTAVVGYAFVASLGWLMWRGLYAPNLRGYAFGAAWFLAALAPTTFVPLAEVLNDHRMMFPMVGLAISLVYAGGNIWRGLSAQTQGAMVAGAVLLLVALAWGTRQRSEVWRTEESLWRDVTEKSPRNGRGQMNYGLALMAKGDLDGAEQQFRLALALLPNYPYAHANLAIALEQRGLAAEAEVSFRNALALDATIADLHYFYGRFLAAQGRHRDAYDQLQRSLKLSDANLYARDLMLDLLSALGRFDELAQMAQDILRVAPKHERALWYAERAEQHKATQGGGARQQGGQPQQPPPLRTDAVAEQQGAPFAQYFNAALAAYQEGRFQDAIAGFNQALAFEPGNADAWNNVCAAHNELRQWEDALTACNKALGLQPDFALALGNRDWAARNSLEAKGVIRPGEEPVLPPPAQPQAVPPQDVPPQDVPPQLVPSPVPNEVPLPSFLPPADPAAQYAETFNIALAAYHERRFADAIATFSEALKIEPNSADAWNNICAAHNELRQWAPAIAACDRALAIAPDSALAQGNKAWAAQNLEAEAER